MSTTQQRWRGSSPRFGRGRAGYSGRVRGGIGSWRRPRATGPPAPPTGRLLAKVGSNDLADISGVEDLAKISSCAEVASFNWLNKKEPTIVVPGGPPAWAPFLDPTKLNEDAGEYFRDPNSARYPSYPMQPSVEAILRQNTDFPTESIDVVACGSTLGNLLRFVRKIDRGYRMVVEAIGSTVFFGRRENSPTQIIPDVYGFGHTFPEAYTTWPSEVKGSESHQRLIQYDFGGMKCVVRFEADGYLPDLVPDKATSKKQELGDDVNMDANQQLSSALDSTTLGMRPTQSKPLSIRSAGDHVPQAAVFDLKTRSIRKKNIDVLGEELPRLWVSQVPNFMLAFHTSGLFDLEEIQTRNVKEEVRQWEEEHKGTLCQLAALLKLLVAFARTQSDARFEIVHEEEGEALELREVCDDVPRMLPHILSDRWTNKESDASEDGGLPALDPDLSDGNVGLEWDSGSEKDYTACSAEDCGYCGHCSY